LTITLVFLGALMAVFVGWLVRQSINVSPWIATGGPHAEAATSMPAAKVGLLVFCAVVVSLFALFASAYMMRMHHMIDWRPLPEPNLLYVNTGILVFASIGLQWASRAAAHGDALGLRRGFVIGGAGAFAFLIGQVLAWQQLGAAGYFLATNPANSFFYVITALHGLHLSGGLVAWGRTARKLGRGLDPAAVRLSVDLCAWYWHFLLLLWVVLFALLLST
jgi:cytochrome c oxidase subunit 3